MTTNPRRCFAQEPARPASWPPLPPAQVTIQKADGSSVTQEVRPPQLRPSQLVPTSIG